MQLKLGEKPCFGVGRITVKTDHYEYWLSQQERGTMKAKFFLLLALACPFYLSSVWAAEVGQKQPTSLLPWQVIAEKFGDKAAFCSIECIGKPNKQAEECRNYALNPNNLLIMQSSGIIEEIEDLREYILEHKEGLGSYDS